MDPAIATIDLVKAGAIVASMVESYLAAAVPPLNAKGADDDDGQDNTGAAPVTDGLRLHPAIDAGAGPLQSGEHRTPVQSGSQGAVAWMEPAADPRSSIATSGSLAPGQRTARTSSRWSAMWRWAMWGRSSRWRPPA